MDIEEQMNSLAAETLALSVITGNVLTQLAGNPALRPAIVTGFDLSADIAQTVAEQFGKSASPDHTIKAMRIIEKMRKVVLGKDETPRKLV